jgi:hypothetical protein
VSHSCGAPIRSIVKTDTAIFETNSSAFVNLPGAVATVDIPAGEIRCVKVRFSASVSCSQTAQSDVCVVRAGEIGGSVFDPAVNGIDFADEQGDALRTHSFEWVKQLSAGSHTIRVQAAVQNAATKFTIGAWTMDVEQTK